MPGEGLSLKVTDSQLIIFAQEMLSKKILSLRLR